MRALRYGIVRALLFMPCSDRGIYLAPSQFEAGFLSTAHRPLDVERTLEMADDALTAVFAAPREAARRATRLQGLSPQYRAG